jgi:hypothetical protein
MSEENGNGEFVIEGRQGIRLVHRSFDCTVCAREEHMWIPADDIEGYARAIGNLMYHGICPTGTGSECSVYDDDGAPCGGEVENLEDYNWITPGEVAPLWTCSRHQGYFIE